MSTVDRGTAEAIMRGEYADDRPVRVVKYMNAWGGEAYGVTFEGQDHDKYLRPSHYINNPEMIWEAA